MFKANEAHIYETSYRARSFFSFIGIRSIPSRLISFPIWSFPYGGPFSDYASGISITALFQTLL
ncbi:Hypothetical protein FKW44_000705 [Caligus rogercresseyi]|uniref:Uncharacterized protein n=1 Tax=Caligus rogercresseyi TaxID=217165 RepID=A0A7T8KHQ0_CALRO|nr:Hypothetical protein FKW44_000705 [Caligus rogercresseyi]